MTFPINHDKDVPAMKIIEEKIHYDGRVDRVECLLLREDPRETVLLYKIPQEYRTKDIHLIPGTFTIAYYYLDQPYNLYHWVTPDGQSLGYYFNMVKDVYKEGNRLSYTDLILDIFVRNDGSHTLLDADELPCPLENFEQGRVKKYMEDFLNKKEVLIAYFSQQSQSLIQQGCFNLWYAWK